MSNRKMINSLLNNYEMQIHTLTAEVERLKALPETRWFDCPEGKQCPYTIPPKPVVWVRRDKDGKTDRHYKRCDENGNIFSNIHSSLHIGWWESCFCDHKVRIWEPTTCPTCNGTGVKP